MLLNVDHLNRTIDTLAQALSALEQHRHQPESIMFDLYRNAAIKSFELSLETAGKLLRKALKSFEASPRTVDTWVFNDVLRYAGKHGILKAVEVERWLAYRANRNSTAHDYGKGFANETLKLLPDYIEDVRHLAKQIQRVFDAAA